MAEGYVLLTQVVEEEEDGQYAAHCPELGVATCGDTIEEAFSNLRDAIEVHLNALEEVGTRERVLQERNIVIHPSTATHEPVNRIVRQVRQQIPASA